MANTTAVQNPQKMTYIPPILAYDRWAEVYDSDSNFLQKFDDLQLIPTLPSFLDLCLEATKHGQVKIVDLGCGTGRNTLKLLSLDGAQIVGLDASPKMLEVARLRCRDRMSSLVADRKAEDVQLELFDMLSGEDPPRCAENAIGVVSTLVLEHIPASSFFERVASLLVSGGYLLVTNMHPEMGARSQAGFQDPHTGEKIRTLSYIHIVEDVVRVASQYNLEVVDRVLERAVNQEDVDILGRRAEKWVGVRCWFGAMFRKSTMNVAFRG